MSNSKMQNSQQFYTQDQNFTSKYLSNVPIKNNQYGLQIMKQHLESQIETINTNLSTITNERLKLGDLFSSSPSEVEKTVEVIKTLIHIRQKDADSRNQAFSNARRIQNQKNQLLIQVQRLQKDKQRLEAEKQNLIQRNKTNERNNKEVVEKLSQQKDEYIKKFRAIQSRETQFKNEHKKLETNIKMLQDRIGKTQEKVSFKNNFQVIQNLQNYGPSVILMNAQHQYNQVVAKTLEQNYNEICKQNQYYKDYLQNVNRQLHSVLDLKKQIMKRRNGFEPEFDSHYQLKPFRSEVLGLPNPLNKEGHSMLTQNIMKFKQAIKTGNYLEDRDSDQKVNCISNVKNLIRNYKNIVQSQDQLLNKVIIKAKDFKHSQNQNLENRFSKSYEEDQLSRAKKFLQQQSNYLEIKNKELQLTRKAMHSTIKRVEEEKSEFNRRGHQANEEILKIRKQVQTLPALVEEELNSL